MHGMWFERNGRIESVCMEDLFAAADLNAVKAYERREGFAEGYIEAYAQSFAEGKQIEHEILICQLIRKIGAAEVAKLDFTSEGEVNAIAAKNGLF